MTVWDADALGAPHTLRELAQDGEPAPGSTTGPENATCPSAGGFGRSERIAENKRRRAICDDHAQMLDAQSQCAPCNLCGGKAVIGDAGPGWGYYIECENAARYTRQTCTQTGVRISGWAYNVSDMWNRLNAVTTTPQAILTAIAAEKATWTHNGVMHDAARMACDNIATRIKQLMGDA